MEKKKISLVIPCRNEGYHLKEVIDSIPANIDEIIIVSNKSTDNTVEVGKNIAKENPRIIVLEDNRTLNGIGYGYAHMTGIAAATGDFIMGGDGDATYPFEDADTVIEFMEKQNLDFVSCNRYPVPKDVKIPFKLQLGVNLLNWEIRILYGLKIKDTLSGMWIFRREIKDKLNLTMGDWNLSPQIKLNAALNPEIRFVEYPIKQKIRLGETKQNYFKTGFSHACWIFFNRFKRK
jgi:glycosyltransferase involved in cell wall biosynthesis